MDIKCLLRRLKYLLKINHPDYQGAYEQLIKTSSEIHTFIKTEPLTFEAIQIYGDLEKIALDCEEIVRSLDGLSDRLYKSMYEQLFKAMVEVLRYARDNDPEIWRMLGSAIVFCKIYVDEIPRENIRDLQNARKILAAIVEDQSQI